MTLKRTGRARWLLVVVFAVAMAWMESATVYYLRALVDRVQPYQPDPLPMAGVLGAVELVREGATLVMLLAAGILAAPTWLPRLGYTAIAFGTWDISYYVFLRIMSGWPASIFDWDILFLLPLPWWGPVLAPVCIAVLMIAWGTLVTQSSARMTVTRARVSWVACGIGAALALVVFMADALQAVPGGAEQIRSVLPARFNWPLFSVALLLMAAPIVLAAQIRGRESGPLADSQTHALGR
jgi:hypothetical protein